MIRFLLATACCLPLLARAEDLLEVYAQARAADPVLAAADAQRGVQRELATQARAALLPQWSASYNSSRADGQDSRIADTSLSQTLVNLVQLRTLDAANTLVSAEDARVRAAEQALCGRVAQAYFDVLSAQAALATAEANEDAFAQQVAQAQTRYETGLSALVDVEQARAYHQLARGNTVQARQALDDARQALAEITGRQPGALQALTVTLSPSAPAPRESAAWIDEALRNNPALLAQQLVLGASEKNIGVAAAGHLPSLSLGLDSSRSTGSAIQASIAGRTINTVGVTLTIPIFAGGAIESQKRQAVYQRDAARDQFEITRRALMRETQAQYQAVLAGVSLVESSAAAVAAADRSLASTRTGQTLGTRSMTDLLLAIQTQATAQNAYAQARHRYVMATLLLQQAAGRLGEDALARVNQMLQGHS